MTTLSSGMTCLPATGHASRVLLVVRDESTWGEWLDTGNDLLELEYRQEGLANPTESADGRHWIFDDQNRAPEAGPAGLRDPGGQISGEMQFGGGWPLLLRHALGEPTTEAGPGGLTRHTLIGRRTLPVGCSIERRIQLRDGVWLPMRYLGCKVDKFMLRMAIGEIPQCRATVIAGSEVLPGSSDEPPTAQSLIDSPRVAGASLQMDIGSGLEPIGVIQTFECLIDNRLEKGQYRIFAGADRDGIPVGNRTVTGSIRVMMSYAAWLLYQQFRGNADFALQLDAPGSGDRNLTVEIPAARLRGTPTPRVAGRGPVNLEFQFHAHYDATVESDIRVVLDSPDPSLSTIIP